MVVRMDEQPEKRGRGRPKTGKAQKGADRQAAYEQRKKARAMTMATTLYRLGRDDPLLVHRLDLPTLEAMRDSLTLTGRAREAVEAWIAKLEQTRR
jgi:hypothetical protein